MFSTFFQVLQIIYFVLSTMYGFQALPCFPLFFKYFKLSILFCLLCMVFSFVVFSILIWPKCWIFVNQKKPGKPFLTLAGILTQANGFFPAASTLLTSNSFSQLLGLAELPKIFQNTSALTSGEVGTSLRTEQ